MRRNELTRLLDFVLLRAGAPGVTDDISKDIFVGQEWLDSVTGSWYKCSANPVGAAVWKQLSNAAGGGGPTYAYKASDTTLGAGTAGTTVAVAAIEAGKKYHVRCLIILAMKNTSNVGIDLSADTGTLFTGRTAYLDGDGSTKMVASHETDTEVLVAPANPFTGDVEATTEWEGVVDNTGGLAGDLTLYAFGATAAAAVVRKNSFMSIEEIA